MARKRIRGRVVRMILIIMVNLVGIYSCTVQAQHRNSPRYIGFEASFGQRSFEVASNIEKINQMQASHEGGSLGLVFGNRLLKTRITVAGVYYSNANTPRTQRLFESGTMVNFYPTVLTRNGNKAKLFPYLQAGLKMDGTKFYGTYLDNQNGTGAYEPYLGKISMVSVKGGIGLEYRLVNDADFVHLFAEALLGVPVYSSVRNNAFSSTNIKGFTSFSVGVSFGMYR